MKKLILTLVAALGLAAGAVHAAGANTIAWDKAPNKTNDLASLQNGAKVFVNYCLSCHSAAFMRFNRLRDIGLPEQQIKDNLLFTTDKVGETMKASIDPKQVKEWFGANPPDLTVIARSRAGAGGTGADYLYTFLRTFYRDETKATGWNNLAFPNAGMPHVMWELQGQRAAKFVEVADPHDPSKKIQAFDGFEQLTPGTMTPQQLDSAMADLTAYLTWMAEPVAQQRVRIGVGVMIFLAIFMFIAWRLNAAFWKDVK
jgi:ubiquinol-cytochrome c reductase cytochrome c1 subunit